MGFTMDPRQYDRIADLLMQIKLKIQNNVQTKTKIGEWTKEDYINRINSLLQDTDALAFHDAQGLL